MSYQSHVDSGIGSSMNIENQSFKFAFKANPKGSLWKRVLIELTVAALFIASFWLSPLAYQIDWRDAWQFIAKGPANDPGAELIWWMVALVVFRLFILISWNFLTGVFDLFPLDRLNSDGKKFVEFTSSGICVSKSTTEYYQWSDVIGASLTSICKGRYGKREVQYESWNEGEFGLLLRIELNGGTEIAVAQYLLDFIQAKRFIEHHSLPKNSIGRERLRWLPDSEQVVV
jgi:hypothetical protein